MNCEEPISTPCRSIPTRIITGRSSGFPGVYRRRSNIIRQLGQRPTPPRSLPPGRLSSTAPPGVIPQSAPRWSICTGDRPTIQPHRLTPRRSAPCISPLDSYFRFRTDDRQPFQADVGIASDASSRQRTLYFTPAPMLGVLPEPQRSKTQGIHCGGQAPLRLQTAELAQPRRSRPTAETYR